MARFRGTLQGSRGTASRLGSPKSRLTVTASGWDIGITVEMRPCSKCGKDLILLESNGGSSGSNTFPPFAHVLHQDRRAGECWGMRLAEKS